MSNRRAPAVVTAAFSELLAEAIDGTLPSAEVVHRRPGDVVGDQTAPKVNLFLYRAVPNGALRNSHDPTRNAQGRVIQRAVAAWDLQFLITCIGKEEQLEPELLLGAVLTALTSEAILKPGFVATVEATLATESDNRKHAAGSALDKQLQVVRLTPIEMSIDTLSQLWSSLTKEPYAVSVAYQASVVLMSAETAPEPSLPVGGDPSLALATLRASSISSVHASDGPNAPIVISSTLVIEGQGLRAEHAVIRIGSLDVELALSAMSATRIELPLAPFDGTGPTVLPPGALGVQFRHRVVTAATSPPELRPGASSNVMPIVLRPAIVGGPNLATDGGGDAAIAVLIAPAASEAWEYCLLLNEFGASSPRAITLSDWSIDTSGAIPQVLFKSGDVPAGRWLVRIQVNGADSPLERDASGFSGPEVTTT